MRQYNSIEARLKAWKRKLARTPGSEELLAILDSDEKANTCLVLFNERKNAILQELEAQEWPWTSFLSWIWSWISAILPASWQSQVEGPSLKKVLEEGVDPAEYQLSEEDISSRASANLLDDSSYEDALFTKPQKALADLKQRIDTLDKSSDIENILQRLYAIKYCLRADTYQTLLTKLFQQHPVKTLNFFYARYTENPNEIPSPQDFIEHELMSRKLMEIFVLPYSADSNSRLFALQELLLALSMCKQNKDPSLKTLLNEGALANKEPSALCGELSSLYDRKIYKQIVDLLPDRVKREGLKIPTYGVSRSPAFNQPLNLLRAVIDNPDNFQQDSYQVQPLYRNIARLATQELLLNYHQISEIRNNPTLHETLDFLSDTILGTGEEAKKERDRLRIPFTISECETLLSPYARKARVPSEYEHAVYFANQLVVANFFATSIADLKNKIIKKSCKYAASIHGDLKQSQQIKPHELSWILSVVERLAPNDKEIIRYVKYIFTELNSYGLADLDRLAKTQSKSSAQELIDQMIIDLADANAAFKELDAARENAAVEKMIIALNDLLENKELSSTKQLQGLYDNVFAPLKSQYLTEELAHKIQKALTDKHSQFTLWNEENIADLAEASDTVVGDFLEIAEQSYANARRDNSLGNFMQEINDSKKAVYYFSLYLNQFKLEKQSVHSLSQARQFFEEKLKPYLKPEQALIWQNKIEQIKRSHSPATTANGAAQGGIFASKAPNRHRNETEEPRYLL